MGILANLVVIATCVAMLVWLWIDNNKRKNKNDD